MQKKGILENLIKNHAYILYYSKIMLKQRVADTYLGFLWLFIQPLMFMLIYSFVVTIIFKSGMEHFNVYVLIGLNAWNLVQRTIMAASTAIVRNKAIFEQVYFHKIVYPSIYLMSYVYEFLIATSLVLIMMVIENIPITWHIIEIVPVLLTCVLFTYGITLIISHIGVYLFDLANILEFMLRFIFYLSPIMWSFDNLAFPFIWLLKLNPVAIILDAFRDCLLYGKSPAYSYLFALSLVSCGLIQWGYWLISKHEDTYARII